jgi:hypothetical protein
MLCFDSDLGRGMAMLVKATIKYRDITKEDLLISIKKIVFVYAC